MALSTNKIKIKWGVELNFIAVMMIKVLVNLLGTRDLLLTWKKDRAQKYTAMDHGIH